MAIIKHVFDKIIMLFLNKRKPTIKVGDLVKCHLYNNGESVLVVINIINKFHNGWNIAEVLYENEKMFFDTEHLTKFE